MIPSGTPLKLGFFLETTALDHAGPLASWSELRETAALAERVGFDAVFVPDHLILRNSPYWGVTDTAARPSWECWTILSAIAAATSRVELGSFVASSTFRNPALLAKMAVTLDEVSGQRFILGLGAGSYAPEHEAFGYPFDHLASRFEESLQILAPLLREGLVDFTGRYHQARGCELYPMPHLGRPPIWVAAYGPRMMRLAARFGDAFVTAWHTSPAAVSEICGAFGEICRNTGRESATMSRVVGTFVALGSDADLRGHKAGSLRGSPQAIAEQLQALHAAGADYLVCRLSPGDRRDVERFEAVIAALR